MDYTLIEKDGVTTIIIPTTGPHGSICFGYAHDDATFMAALNTKGIEVFIQLLVYEPATAYTIFTDGV